MTKSHIKNMRRKRKARRKRLFVNIIAAVLIIMLAFAVSAIFRDRSIGSGKYVFGFQSYITLSDSMNPVIMKGSMIITQRVNPGAIRAGDIISYREDTEILTQRVVEIENNNNALSFITRGDANEGVNSRPAAGDDVIGRFVYAVSFADIPVLAMRNPVIMSLCAAGALILIMAFDAANRRAKRRLHRKNRRRRRYPQDEIKASPDESRFENQSSTCVGRRSSACTARKIYVTRISL